MERRNNIFWAKSMFNVIIQNISVIGEWKHWKIAKCNAFVIARV